MNEAVKTAITDLLTEPCRSYKDRAINAVDAATESERRLAIGMIEDHIRLYPGRVNGALLDTLVALRRT